MLEATATAPPDLPYPNSAKRMWPEIRRRLLFMHAGTKGQPPQRFAVENGGKLDVEDRSRTRTSAEQMMPDADARLLEQILLGDAAAGQQFVQEHYHAIY